VNNRSLKGAVPGYRKRHGPAEEEESGNKRRLAVMAHRCVVGGSRIDDNASIPIVHSLSLGNYDHQNGDLELGGVDMGDIGGRRR
jgi:hypothetical protein